MEDIAISIIIPVFNIESYIKDCLSSVINQDIRNIEIICINDCSTDNSLKILNEMKKIDDRIIILNHDKNKGLSEARNTGTLKSKGEYLLFLDGDDFLVNDSLKQVLKDIEDLKLDIIRYNFMYFYNDKNVYVENKRYKIKSSKLLTGMELFGQLYDNDDYKPMAWLSIYRREFINENKIYFLNGILHEDVEFTPRVLVKAKKTKLSNTNLVVYRIRENSITTTVNPKKNKDLLYIVKELKDMVDEEVLEQKVKGKLYSLIASNLLFIINNMSYEDISYYNREIKYSKIEYTLFLSREWKKIIRYLIIKAFSIKGYWIINKKLKT